MPKSFVVFWVKRFTLYDLKLTRGRKKFGLVTAEKTVLNAKPSRGLRVIKFIGFYWVGSFRFF